MTIFCFYEYCLCRRFNRERSENAETGSGDTSNLNNFDEEFGTFTNKSTENAASTNEAWGADNEEWDLKVLCCRHYLECTVQVLVKTTLLYM